MWSPFMWSLFIELLFIELLFIDEPFIDDELFIECIPDGLGLGEPLMVSAIAGAAARNAAARIAIK